MKHFFLLLFMLVSLQLLAQNPTPVKWTFSAKEDKLPNTYIVIAKATIENGWHIFSLNPGGDGFLIPTAMTINNDPIIKIVDSLKMVGNEITKNMDGVGIVHFFEHQVEMHINITSAEKKPISGMVTYQLCNDNMCLPPTDIPFTINLN